MNKALPVLAVSSLIFAGWSTTASAADPTTVEHTVVSQALQSLGVDPNEDLVTELSDVIDPTDLNESVVTEVNDSLDAGGDGTTDLTDSMDSNLEEQSGIWTDFGQTWHVAFDAVKANFDACRAAAVGSASACAAQFTGTLHVAHAQAMLDWAKSQQALIATLPVDQQAAAAADIAAAIARAEQHLADTTGREAAKAARVQDKLNRQLAKANAVAGTEVPGGTVTEPSHGGGKPDAGNAGGSNPNAHGGAGHQNDSTTPNGHGNPGKKP